jgi:hypothetical protein
MAAQGLHRAVRTDFTNGEHWLASVKDHDVIQTFATNRTDYVFNVCILPKVSVVP